MKIPCAEGVELKKKTLFHCQNFKEKPLNSKNLLKADPTKLGKIFEKVKTFLS